MLTKPILSLIAALALACALPACGDDDEPATGGTTQEQTETGSADSTPAPPSSEDVDAAIERCKQSVRDQPQLSDDAKSDIEALCDEAKDGDAEDVKDASRKVCERLVEETVPEGSARDQALETCKTATE